MSGEWRQRNHETVPAILSPSMSSASFQGMASNSFSRFLGYLRGNGKSASATNSSMNLADGYITGARVKLCNGPTNGGKDQCEGDEDEEEDVEVERELVHKEKYKKRMETFREDSDLLHLQSLLPFIKQIPLDKKLECRNQIQEIVRAYAFCNDPCGDASNDQLTPKCPEFEGYSQNRQCPPQAPPTDTQPKAVYEPADSYGYRVYSDTVDNTRPPAANNSKCKLNLPYSSDYCRTRFGDTQNPTCGKYDSPRGFNGANPDSLRGPLLDTDYFDIPPKSKYPLRRTRSGQYPNLDSLDHVQNSRTSYSDAEVPEFYYQQQRRPNTFQQRHMFW